MYEVPVNKIEKLIERADPPGLWNEILDSITPETPSGLYSAASLINSGLHVIEAFNRILEKADEIKRAVFGNEIKLFVPVYLSNVCINNCAYCAYRRDNLEMPRKTLTEEEFRDEIIKVTGMGYRVLELVTGESPSLIVPGTLANYVKIAREILDNAPVAGKPSEIILMSWALDGDEFESVKNAGADSFYLWQETYEEAIYGKVHDTRFPKADFSWRLGVFDRAIKSGIRRFGIGVLFGLGRFEFDLLALISHGKYLEETYGITIDALGIPRFKPAEGAPMVEPLHEVTDEMLKLAVALYRLAFPKSHVFLNTREKLNLLYELLGCGGSEMNIACAVYPGGYTRPTTERQFQHYSYPTEKTIESLKERGYAVGDYFNR
ncbi:MAG TPA: radical SAM protein [Firmicutes bacterium]|nr:radical SAM protein [Bacillota bacterium]